jgi:aspartyl-tRNA(Asn)/glutamyl-tRNA(Gln) amidotransferase subunit B
VEALGLKEADAAILAGDKQTGDYFEAILAAGAPAPRASALMEALRELANENGTGTISLGVPAARVAEIAKLVADGKIAASKETAKRIVKALAEKDSSAETAAGALGLLQTTDTGAVDTAIDAVLAQNPPALTDYRSGKQAAFGALVGMVMKSGKGLNPKMVQEGLRRRLNG